MPTIKLLSLSSCLSLLMLSVAALTPSADADAAPKRSKSLAKVLKVGGLRKAPAPEKALSSKRNKSKGSLLAFGAAPTLSEMLNESDVDELFWNGSLSKILSEDNSGCNNFFDGHLACGLNEDMIRAVAEAGGAGITSCYLSSMVNLESGVEYTSNDGTPISSIFTPPAGAENRFVKIRISGFSGDNEAGAEDIVARITAVDNLGTKAFEIKLNFCPVSSGESRGGNLLQIFKSGKYISKDFSSEEDRENRFSFSSKVKVSSNSRNIEFEPNAKTVMSVSSAGSTSSFHKELVLQNGRITIRSNDRFGESEDQTRSAIVRLLISGTGQNARLTTGAVNAFDGGRSLQGGVSWNSNQNRFVLSDSNSLLSGIEDEDPTEELGEIEAEIEDLPACDTPEEDFSAVIDLDFSDPAAEEMASKCEPLRLHGEGLCRTEQVRQAEDMYGAVCNEGGGPGEGEGGGPGEGEGGGPGEGEPE